MIRPTYMRYHSIIGKELGMESALVYAALDIIAIELDEKDKANAVVKDEERYYISKNEMITQLTGLTAYQIRKGLKALESAGLIKVAYHGAPALRIVFMDEEKLFEFGEVVNA